MHHGNNRLVFFFSFFFGLLDFSLVFFPCSFLFIHESQLALKILPSLF